ncbi:electron transfer flavoprotein subunit beta/FixA family protein [Ruminiclostridium cellobioparum]|uniref:electron transfer flavoprotein subunit beta/FixA family protein n=1 Tax=Ruminiclostridium cellobioparum TaxID=29355 RepID=UPI0028B0250C|nr:electron transfer flavoprotein subunit beta/FixA family protein [Ruminiclostridium cellobioparum]
MKLICVVKFVPDVDNFRYDFENNKLIREDMRLTLNPDDACAVAFALKVKEKLAGTVVEVVTMAPEKIIPHMEDLLRLGVDKGVILSDKAFAGSDTYVTSKVLSRYLLGQHYDCIITGTHAVDGDTAHVPAQLGEWLGLNQMSGITMVDIEKFNKDFAYVDVDNDQTCVTYEVSLPAVLSLTRESGYKLPYVRKGEINRDVKSSIYILDREDLGLNEDQTGLKGSLTQVVETYAKQYEKRERTLVKADNDGVETVFHYLKEKGFI